MSIQVLSGISATMDKVEEHIVETYTPDYLDRTTFDDEDIVELRIELNDDDFDKIVSYAEKLEGYGGWYLDEED